MKPHRFLAESHTHTRRFEQVMLAAWTLTFSAFLLWFAIYAVLEFRPDM